MKNKILPLIALVSSLVFLTACKQKSITTKSSNSQDKTAKNSNSKNKVSTSRADSSQSTSSLEEKEYQGAIKRIGSDDYGYVSIPEKWVTFKDLSGGDSIQFANPDSPFDIITLNAYTKEKAGVKAGQEFTAELVSNSLYASFSENPLYKDITPSMSKIEGEDAYQLLAETKGGLYILTWTFKLPSTDKVYYISIEGEKENLASLYQLIEKTWSLRK